MKRTGFKQKKTKPLKRSGFKQKSLKKKVRKKTKKISSYKGIENTRRWVGADGWRGMFWTIFSMYTRKRDFEKYNKCISCGAIPEHWRNWDAGHYVAVSGGNANTHYSEKNVHGQCKRCNNPKWSPDSSIPYRIELIKRIGEEYVVKLEKIRISKVAGKEPTKKEYINLTEKYYRKYMKL